MPESADVYGLPCVLYVIEEVEDVYKKALDYGWMLFKDVAKNLTHAINHATPQGEDFSYYPSKMNHLLGDRADFRR